MFDVVAFGELLVDFTENGMSGQGNALFEANPGGAPCNVLAMLHNLGRKTAFIGKVGNDIFGHTLKAAAANCGIDTSGVIMDDAVHTTLAFVHTSGDGDRDFSFYRNPGADMMLRKEEVRRELLENTKIFHYGTLSSTHKEVREATRFAVETAKAHGALLSFDPNLREPLWESLADAKREIAYGLSHCDILKISDNEIEFMTGCADSLKGIRKIQEEYHIPVAFATMGRGGSAACFQGRLVSCGAFLLENTIETTGAGDTFMGCILGGILEYGLNGLTAGRLESLLRFANAGAALITTKKGALRVMPTAQEIKSLLERRPGGGNAQ